MCDGAEERVRQRTCACMRVHGCMCVREYNAGGQGGTLMPEVASQGHS